MSYAPSIKDIVFCMDHVTEAPRLYGTAPFPEVDVSLRDAVLDAAGDLARHVLAPLNAVGDKTPARLENGAVVASPGFEDALKTFGEGGWAGLSAPEAFGGQNLPKVLEMACYDLFQSANMAFSLCPTLTQGAIEALHVHGSEAQKALYLPKLISGEWTGTMNLTEPQAGSDLAALTTRAEPDGGGRYRLTGQKIFITWGDHGGTENILHLVLARLPDAPAGTRGISLFLCPKRKLGPEGKPTVHNDIKVAGLEHKLGIHGSPTCVMVFEGAEAELIGQPHQGLPAMFTMMNAARLAVAFQGVGQADGAFQKALAYAKDRRQGRSLMTGDERAPIFDHPDIRLTLSLMKAKLDAARALSQMTAINADLARIDGADAKANKLREDFLVPVAKAFATDIGVEVASSGVQVHGGMGFIEETGAAQYYRDARIAPIYEGTNGIQALDLVGRKLGTDGLAAESLYQDMEIFIANNRLNSPFKRELVWLEDSNAAFIKATRSLVSRKTGDMAGVAAAATAYLRLVAETLGGWCLLKGAMAAISLMDQGHEDTEWLASKVAIARVYGAQILSRSPSLMAAIEAGCDDLLSLTVEGLI